MPSEVSAKKKHPPSRGGALRKPLDGQHRDSNVPDKGHTRKLTTLNQSTNSDRFYLKKRCRFFEGED